MSERVKKEHAQVQSTLSPGEVSETWHTLPTSNERPWTPRTACAAPIAASNRSSSSDVGFLHEYDHGNMTLWDGRVNVCERGASGEDLGRTHLSEAVEVYERGDVVRRLLDEVREASQLGRL